MELAVVAPQAQIVHRLAADEAGLAGDGLHQVLEERREEPAAVERHAGLFGDGVDVVLRGRFSVADHGVAADRAGVAARVAHRVVPHRRAHVELGRAGAVADVVEVVRVHVRVGEHDGRIGGTPLGAREGGPAARRRVVLEHRMRLARDDGVRVRAEDLAVGVDELLPFLRIGVDVDGLVAVDDDALEVLLAHHGAETAGGVALVDHHVRHRHEVFTGLADHAEAGFGRRFLGEDLGGTASALPPGGGGVADLDLFVVDVEVDGALGFAFDDHEVPARELELVGEFAADVGGGDQGARPGGRPERRDGGAAGADGAGARERARSDHELVFRCVAVGFGRNFVPEDLVAEGGAADVAVKAREGRLDRDLAGREVNAQTLAGVAVFLVFRHF